MSLVAQVGLGERELVGIVGAGGIGQPLFENIRSFQYGETAAIIVIVVVILQSTRRMARQLEATDHDREDLRQHLTTIELIIFLSPDKLKEQ